MFVDPCIIVLIHIKNATTCNSVSKFISYLYEAQHVSGDIPPIIRSLKLHSQPLVLHTWRVVGRVVAGRCQCPATTRPTTLHVCKTRGCYCSFRLLKMVGLSPETWWASYKYEINFDALLHLVGFFIWIIRIHSLVEFCWQSASVVNGEFHSYFIWHIFTCIKPITYTVLSHFSLKIRHVSVLFFYLQGSGKYDLKITRPLLSNW